MAIQYITDSKGKRKGVFLTLKEYKRMMEVLEEAEDVRLYDEAKARNEKSIPFEEYLLKRKKRKHA